MSRRIALLIGAPDPRIQGVEGDLDRMEEALARHGFVSERLFGPAATRAGILAALDALQGTIQGGDAVVVYYSGHGGKVANPRAGRARVGGLREPAFYRALIPTDIRETTPTEFRGVLSIELDARIAAIADRSANVAVILDCCYSEGIARGVDDEPLGERSLPMGPPWLAPIEALRDALLRAGVDPDDLAAEADPRVIRLSASGPQAIAVEARDERGCAGLFTIHLAAALLEAADATMTWLALGRRVRTRVMAKRPRQRPVLKGPGDRLLFRLEEAPPGRSFAVLGGGARPRLDGGAMAGVEVGDRVLLIPSTVDGAPLGAAAVTRVDASTAELEVEGRVDLGDLTSLAALPERYLRPRARVRVRATPAIDALVRRALPRSGIACADDDHDHDHDRPSTPWVAEIVEREGVLTIAAADGAPLRAPIPLRLGDDARLDLALAYVAESVEILALGRSLAELAERPEEALDRARPGWTIEARGSDGEVERGEPDQYSADAPLRLGDGRDLVITLRDHHGLMAPLYGWVFSICPSGQVRLLSRRHPWGALVGADEPYILGDRLGGRREGIEVRSAAALPQGGPSRGELVLIAADGQADLRAWERRAEAFRGRDRLDPAPVLRARDLAAEGPPKGLARRFAVWHVPTELRPK
ncbi:MAG: caspase family protein [Myxococcales bacterium]|nr:caspase family protein [Myxococcales bacterium]